MHKFFPHSNRNIYEPQTILDSISLEEGIPKSAELKLAALGNSIEVVTGHERALFGRGQVISRGSSWWRLPDVCDEGKNGAIDHGRETDKEVVYWAGSDPRADGLVASF